MIRIDELYNNTFWPWFNKNRTGTRVFHCEPFGRSDADSVINYGRDDIPETYYTFFFDQEPIDLARHRDTLDRVKFYASDIEWEKPADGRYLVTSEKDSDTVDQICAEYGYEKKYYFFHGWAALDWYRGYDKTFLMTPPEERVITKTFIAPNRIVAGERQHRLIMLYHIFKNNMTDNWISCPAVCPVENIPIQEAVRPLDKRYPDIHMVFAQQKFPMDFPNESGAPMHSCWLSLFDECAESLLYLVTETVATGRRLHLTEKTFKPICLRMPFVIVGTKGSLAYLRSYGFKTFGDIWDESYDDEEDDDLRIERIASLLRSLDELPPEGKEYLFIRAQEIIEHNYNHFYNGGFEKILWEELNEMLNSF